MPTPCSPTSSTERGGDCSSAATTISTSSRRRPASRAGGSSKGRSHRRPTPWRVLQRAPPLEGVPELWAEVRLEAVDERFDLVGGVERKEPERAGVDGLSSLDPGGDELGDDLVAERLERLEDGTDRRPVGVDAEGTEQQAVLAHRRAHDVPCGPLDPFVGNVVAPGERSKCHRGHPAVGVSAETHDLVAVRLRICEGRDAGLEGRQRLEPFERHVPPVVLGIESHSGRADVVGLEGVYVEVPLVTPTSCEEELDSLDDHSEQCQRSEEREADEQHDSRPLQDFHVRTVSPAVHGVKGAPERGSNG